MRIVFMGTPDFAVASLDVLVRNNFNIVGVITAPDKPAGRGQQLQQSAVKKYALTHSLKILQPEKLKNEHFLEELKALQADLQIVVAFRMLPEIVWQMPPKGTFNLHASLLPQYRGAAPINWAVINGEKETGVSTFFLQQEIDTGKIIFQTATPITENETAGSVHDRLMTIGADLVLKTVKAIEQGNYPETDQRSLIRQGETLKEAPKIFKEDCRISWKQPILAVYNHIRGLSPYPGAFTDLYSPEGASYTLKIFSCTIEKGSNTTSGNLITDGKTYLKVGLSGGNLCIEELQLAGKRKMKVQEFLRGFPVTNSWKVS